jgi:hypothetical protein
MLNLHNTHGLHSYQVYEIKLNSPFPEIGLCSTVCVQYTYVHNIHSLQNTGQMEIMQTHKV